MKDMKVSRKAAQILVNSLDNNISEDTDVVVNELVETAKTVIEGKFLEQAEAYAKLNSLLTVTIDPKVQENLKDVLGRYGQTHSLSRKEAAVIERYEHELRGARRQAEGGDIRFGKVSKVNVPVLFETVTAGFTCDYRDLIDDALGFLKEYVVEVMTSMDNEVIKKVVTELTSNIKSAAQNGKVVYYATGNGISQTALDEAIKQVRRTGNANIFGDFSVITQLEDFVGFKTDNYFVLAEQRLLEIDNMGYIAKYRGSNITEIKNAFDFYATETNSVLGTKTYKTLLPESDLFVMASGKMGPNHIFFRGGVTTQTGSSVPNATEEQRWDMECATYFVEDRAHMLGLIQDADLV